MIAHVSDLIGRAPHPFAFFAKGCEPRTMHPTGHSIPTLSRLVKGPSLHLTIPPSAASHFRIRFLSTEYRVLSTQSLPISEFPRILFHFSETQQNLRCNDIPQRRETWADRIAISSRGRKRWFW